MSGNSAFELIAERGWRRGMGNMLRSELAHWWKTSMWWVQCLIWAGMIGFMLSAIFLAEGDFDPAEAVMIYGLFAGLFPAIGVVIILQDAVVGEKESGTAAWVLSKPVSRQAFILSKLIAHSLGVTATMVVIPGIVAYAVFAIAGGITLNPVWFLAALGVILLNHVFFLAFTLMLGTLFNTRGPVIGLALALVFLQQNLIGMLPALQYVLPWTLVAPPNNGNDSLVSTLLMGHPAPSWIQIGLISVEIVVFIVVALRRFEKEEF